MGNAGPHHSNTSVRLPDTTLDAIRAIADANGSTVTDVVKTLIETQLFGNPALFLEIRRQAYGMALRMVKAIGDQVPETFEEAVAGGWLAPPSNDSDQG